MAKALYIHTRKELPLEIRERVAAICDALAPDNIAAQAPQIWSDAHSALGVINPNELVRQKNKALLLGAIYGDYPRWDQPTTEQPDGSFALFREDADFLEVVSDPGGSRTLWYYFDDEQFLAATSQQAIIMYLGSFEFDDRVIPWMLSTSGIGPGLSWDRRIKCVRPDTAVVLDKRSWSVKERSMPIRFQPRERSDEAHQQVVRQALDEAFSSLNLDLSQWTLSLSGGYDSRAVLAILASQGQDLSGLGAVTWGTRAALADQSSDAVIARRLAEHFGVDHTYFVLDESPKTAEEIIERFFLFGEGRVDHLAGYLDGFEIWRNLYDHGVKGMLRGDEGFGLKNIAVASPLTVRLSVRLGQCTDFTNLKDYEKFGLPRQEIPEYLQQQPGESLSTWRDRLFHQYKLPFVVAALSDLKSPYVDQVNPLLSRRILEAMRQLPDHLRDGKVLFRKIISEVGPDIPIARRASSIPTCAAVKRDDLMEMIEEELRSHHARSIMPPEFVERSLHQFLAVRDADSEKSALGLFIGAKQHLRRVVSGLTPRPVKNLLIGNNVVTHHVDVAVVAWRLFLVSRMSARLRQAARSGAEWSGRSKPTQLRSNHITSQSMRLK